MLLRLRLLVASLGGGILLLLILCLGAQNLDQRARLNLGFGKTAALPTGFMLGVALVIGVISGKHWSAVITPRGSKTRIISARRSRREEMELYES